ncbi:hypothetical protein C8P63_104186 [Melghirimyces profundicolus]|uniref:UMP kinase n=1 Tax=Melghirimyces profundicolus TaxID=1242148 RepID=A0A2T6C4T9_9BACL|nr:hypothetical protein C8P63_104186 [Melghirimyces profundicolus]
MPFSLGKGRGKCGIAGTEGEAPFSVDCLDHIAEEIISLTEMGVQVSVVIGGGNIFRGRLADIWGIDRVEADNIGTLGTGINSLMLRGVLRARRAGRCG